MKEKSKTDDDGDDSGDENDKYMDLDNFLSKITDGNTLLHMVLERKLFDPECLSLLNLLKVHGARVCTKDEYGHKPRELAFILIGSSRKRQDMNVIAMLEREEAWQESQKRKVDREKLEVIAMTVNERIGKMSMFEHVDPEVISQIFEEVRKETAIFHCLKVLEYNIILGWYF